MKKDTVLKHGSRREMETIVDIDHRAMRSLIELESATAATMR